MSKKDGFMKCHINTLEVFIKLKESGMPEEQAHIIVEALREGLASIEKEVSFFRFK